MTNHRRFDIGSSTSESFEGDEALATAVKSLVWDGDDDFLRARIQASRASGERVLLPTVQPARVPLPETNGRRWFRRVMRAGAGVAAVLVVAVIVRRVPDSTAHNASSTRDADTTRSSRESFSDLIAPWPRMAFALGALRLPEPYAPVAVSGSQRVIEGDRAYVQLVAPHQGAEMIPIAYSSVSVSRDTTQDALCVVTRSSITEDDAGRRRVALHGFDDTLLVDAASLRPMVHSYSTGNARTSYHSTIVERFHQDRFGTEFRYRRPLDEVRLLQKRFPGDRSSGWTETRPIDTTRLYVPDEQSLLLVLQAVPLHDGWRGSIQVPSGLGAIYQQTVPLNLRVEGVDTVAVYRDRYPTWRVLLENGATPEVWHVRQATGEVLLIEQRDRNGAPRAKRYLIGGLAWPDSGRVGAPR